MSQTLSNFTPSYTVEFDDLQILMLDASITTYDSLQSFNVDHYIDAFNAAAALYDKSPAKPAWFVTHQPFRALVSFYDRRKRKDVVSASQPFNTYHSNFSRRVIPDMNAGAVKNRLTGAEHTIDAVIAGHIHLSETLDFNDHRPHQLVFGASGAKLDNDLSTEQDRASPLATLGARSFAYDREFDYAVMTYNAADSSRDVSVHVVPPPVSTIKIGGE